MPIPRPPNLQPLTFDTESWRSQDTYQSLRSKFRPGSLPAKVLFKSIFQTFNITVLGNQQPWDILLRDPQLEQDSEQPEGHLWEPVRILGAGSFGRVALWQKKRDDKVVDEVALKDALRGDEEDEIKGKEGLPIEAVINAELNEQTDCKRICFLRNFKFYPEEEEKGRKRKKKGKKKSSSPYSSAGLYRFYFNFCPYDSLETLANRYALFEEWLPEAFIWHLLIQLLDGLKALERDPPDETLVYYEGDKYDAFTLHLDLKPGNILLDYADEDSEQSFDFPDIRIGDFGLAMYTGPEDTLERNPYRIQSCGTKGYKPPEQTYEDTDWGHYFAHPPNFPHTGYEEGHNVWGIGKVVFDVMTHENRYTIDDWIEYTDSATYDANEQHFLPVGWGDEKFWNSKADIQKRGREQVEQEHAAAEGRVRQTRSQVPGPTRNSVTPVPGGAQPQEAQVVPGGDANVNARFQTKEQREEYLKMCANAEKYYRTMAKNWRYSYRLRQLVRDMLFPMPSKRPFSIDLLRRARTGYEEYLESQRRAQKRSASGESPLDRRLYFRENEINKMPAGKGHLKPDAAFYRALVMKCDPDWELLRPPQKKWQRHVANAGPMAPVVEVFDGKKRLSNAEVRLRRPTSSHSSKRSSDAIEDTERVTKKPRADASKNGEEKKAESIRTARAAPSRSLRAREQLKTTKFPAGAQGVDPDKSDTDYVVINSSAKRGNKGEEEGEEEGEEDDEEEGKNEETEKEKPKRKQKGKAKGKGRGRGKGKKKAATKPAKNATPSEVGKKAAPKVKAKKEQNTQVRAQREPRALRNGKKY